MQFVWKLIYRIVNQLLPYYLPEGLEAGCDEAGRGCLAGPVYAAAVILPPILDFEGLDDSKKLSKNDRKALRPLIEENAIAWAVGIVDHQEIDEINILNASFLAMHRAVELLGKKPDRLLIDGNRFKPYKKIPFHCIVKGDGKYKSIAAASILAKTYRDDYMQEQAIKHPEYSWHTNKGYPTKAHREAIVQYGVTPIHRMTFRLLPDESQGVLFDLDQEEKKSL